MRGTTILTRAGQSRRAPGPIPHNQNERTTPMAQYLVQVSYTSEACAALVNNPQDRLAVVSKAVKKLGGKLINGWMCLADFDTVVLITLPDNVAAAAFSIAL